ncbi:hypothetical protein DAPPUDRAFT_265919 [Daphnia pulex]|uniref:Uncharacterized protein n=1 Tax=Daphnia pulex TaxID=6669 RepID=E9HU75_DAPPU|nr:hypothetical protein DAPPUDRAFT_265919 [Daphnia pulex]|eukprot:EFX64693.1 hypothetical protein DAPPUDRAFT_265919 [Daphnia pulex]
MQKEQFLRILSSVLFYKILMDLVQKIESQKANTNRLEINDECEAYCKKFEIESSDSGDDSKNNDHPIKETRNN